MGALLRRLRSRLGTPNAIAATAHKLARILYNLMRYGLVYMKQSDAAYAEQVRLRLEKQLHRRATELGFTLTKIEASATLPVAKTMKVEEISSEAEEAREKSEEREAVQEEDAACEVTCTEVAYGATSSLAPQEVPGTASTVRLVAGSASAYTLGCSAEGKSCLPSVCPGEMNLFPGPTPCQQDRK